MSETMDMVSGNREKEIFGKVLKEIGDFEYVTISALQSHFAIGFPKAIRVFKRLQDMGIAEREKTD